MNTLPGVGAVLPEIRATADFIKKGTFSVHSFNDDYLSIPERPGS